MTAGSGWNRRKWSEADEAYLRAHYAECAATGKLTELAAHFGCDRKSVREKARWMGLHHSPHDAALRARFGELPPVDAIRYAWEACNPQLSFPPELCTDGRVTTGTQTWSAQRLARWKQFGFGHRPEGVAA